MPEGAPVGTDGLRSAGHRAWEATVGALVSVRCDRYRECADPARKGSAGEDGEFGHRLAQRGAVFVHEPRAVGWRVGSPRPEAHGAGSAHPSGPFLENRVPRQRGRRSRPFGVWEVPFVDVVVEAAGAGYDAVSATVDGVLGGDLADVRVWLVGEWSRVGPERHAMIDDPDVDLRLVHEHYRCDGRVRCVGSAPAVDPDVPFRLLVAPGALLAPHAVRELTATADREDAGIVRVDGHERGDGAKARLERTSAFARARHLGAAGAGLDAAVVRLWGEYAVEGGSVLLADTAGTGPPANWPARMRKADRALEAARSEAGRWERRIGALTRGRGMRLLTGRWF